MKVNVAGIDDAAEIVQQVGALLHEITVVTGQNAFDFDVEESTSRLIDFLGQEKYFVLVSRADKAGSVALSPCTKAWLCMQGADSEPSPSALCNRNTGRGV